LSLISDASQKKNIERNFKFKDGKIAINHAENTEILKKNFSTLFNSQAEADFSVVNKIPNYITRYTPGKVPTNLEIKKAVSQMANY
jgi:hypothetical protein